MKPLNLFSTGLLLLVCGSSVSCGQILLPDAKVTVRVLDENKQPIEGADASVGFEVISNRSFESKSEGHHGLTGADGLFTASQSTVGLIFYGARKAGYYDTTGPDYRFTSKELGRWQPYNVGFEVVLKKIVNPVPMFAKHVNVGVPALGAPLGFDLSTGDWTSPYGKGTTTDIIFTAEMNKRAENDYDYRLTVSFPNKGDGIQLFEAPYNYGSALKSPREAPVEGYLPNWVITSTQRPGSPRVSSRDAEKHNYFLRVRTVLDEQGHVVRACYGKIYGDFMDFTYFLNPDTTRNLEYDVKHELMTGLQSFEKPRVP